MPVCKEFVMALTFFFFLYLIKKSNLDQSSKLIKWSPTGPPGFARLNTEIHVKLGQMVFIK
jgi:hypothetical protein